MSLLETVLTAVSLLLYALLFPVSWLLCLTTVAEYERAVVFR